MNKKKLETFCVLLIIITTFVIIGYYTYKSYENKKNSNDGNVEINNFYNVDYLFNNSYIDIPKTIDDFSSKEGKIYIYLDASNIMYIKYTDKEKNNKKVTGLPKGNVTVYYNKIYDDYYEFLARTDNGDVYYSYININDSKDAKYVLIGSNIDKIYVPYYDKNGIYVNQKNKFTTNFILYDKEEQLKYIDIQDNNYLLKGDLEIKKPYFDYICASNNSDICNKYMVYITFSNELVYNKEKLKNSNGDIIHVKDVFSSFEIISKKSVDLDNIKIKDLKKNSYLFSTYIVDDNQILYQLDISNNNEKMVSLNDTSNKIKEYIYEDDGKLTISFEDGTKKVVEKANNKVFTTSTIYDKKQRNNETVLIQP